LQYLLDTDVLICWLIEPKKLSNRVREIIEEPDNKIFISCISLWEMALKQDVGKLRMPMNILTTIHADNIQILPLAAEEALAVINLPKLHLDPFDRLLLTQAKLNDLIVITKDQIMTKYPIVCICD
jgi:PIN domain nuclease of toxin-antitoxin system